MALKRLIVIKSSLVNIKKLKPVVIAMILSFPSLGVQAAAIDAGSILQQIKPTIPEMPTRVPSLNIDKSSTPGDDKSTPAAVQKTLFVKTIVITGNTKIDTTTLHHLVAQYEGKNNTVAELKEMTGIITDYYHSKGYPLALTILPRQNMQGGVLTIEIVEAKYSKVNLINSSLVNSSLLQSTLSPLKGGDVVNQADLDHQLMLLSDIPGVIVNATLKSGAEVGSSDLDVSTTPSQSWFGNVAVDNFGNSYTGRPRVSGSINKVDPFGFGLGDILSLNGLSSGSDLNYGRVAYESVLNGYGTRAGASYSAVHYKLGGTAAGSNSDGNAEVAEVWVKHPLMRTRNINLYGQLKLDQLTLADHSSSGALKKDRSLTNGAVVFNGDLRENALLGGVETFEVGLTSGSVNNLDFVGTTDLANIKGSFSKLNINVTALQRLTESNSAFLLVSTQFASKNLDPSQKMIVGGTNTVRAYDSGSISGDSGYLVSAELRHDLGEFYGKWNGTLFVDGARVTVNTNVISPGSTNAATLMGVGAGVNWFGTNNYTASAYLATPIGSTPVIVATQNSARLWVEMGKRF